jgi:hypothetical protein
MTAALDTALIKVKLRRCLMKSLTSPEPEMATYQIVVNGPLNPAWLQDYAAFENVFDGRVTILTGLVPDQSALRGLLCWLWDLNITLLSVKIMAPGSQQESEM